MSKSSDSETEGVWRHIYTGEEFDLSFAVGDKLNGGKRENCAIIVPAWKGWNDWSCIINEVSNNFFT